MTTILALAIAQIALPSPVIQEIEREILKMQSEIPALKKSLADVSRENSNLKVLTVELQMQNAEREEAVKEAKTETKALGAAITSLTNDLTKVGARNIELGVQNDRLASRCWLLAGALLACLIWIFKKPILRFIMPIL